MDSHEIMSFAELTRRLSEVRRAEEHLKMLLPVDSPHNAILRLREILAYTHIPYEWARRQFPEMYRFKSLRPPPKGNERPADKHEIEERQIALSRFFYAWDRGTVIKARVGNEWRLVARHQDAVPLGAAPRPPAAPRKVIEMHIDRETLGLRFK